MATNKQRNRLTLRGIDSLWINWALSAGALALTVLFGVLFTKLWLPAFVLGFAFILMRRIAVMRDSDSEICNILPYITVRILFVAAAIMVGINLYYMKFMDPQEYLLGHANKNIPYITILILAPVMLVISIWGYVMRHRISFCHRCTVEHGTPQERGFMGRVFDVESRYQLRMLIFISAVLSIYSWTYYLTTYNNVNMNPSDLYYYIAIPVALYVLSLAYLAMRYFRIYMFYRENVVGDASSAELTTILRYILICDDYVFLNLVDEDDRKRADTPAMTHIPYRERMTSYDAAVNFSLVSGINDKVDIKFLYENSNNHADSNIFHYLCVVPSRTEVERSRLSGEWFSQNQLERMHAHGELSGLLMSEIHRVYTVMMTKKTYDRWGYRLYDIKHYKPTFRLHELEVFDGDFNDPVWLLIAKDNEDTPFFKLRRFWRKHVRDYGQ